MLGLEPGEEAVRALHLPTFESRSPLASVGREEEVREPEVKEDTTSHPFVISGALPVVPAKVVCIDMAELLKNNTECERRRRAADADSMPSGSMVTRREIPDMMS